MNQGSFNTIQELTESQELLEPNGGSDHNLLTSSEESSMNEFADEISTVPVDPTKGEERPSHEDEEISKEYRMRFEKLLGELEKLKDPEAKLQLVVDFMESSLAQSGTPHFKSFWEARTICLQLFKENLSPALRSTLWTRYHLLSKEARRLKEILDEQSAFAVEQIEIAIQALENDISTIDEHLKKMRQFEFRLPSRALANHIADYQQFQGELNLLNTHASRINALRKELIKTEMRVRQKNKFFQRLSIAGDKIFPRRKELIKEVSQRFISDVDAFIQEHFANENFYQSIFILREEIKALQNIAKALTLNTHAFTHTRMRLSECWDCIKGLEKERKKERAQQKNLFKQNFDHALQKIEEFKQAYQAGTMSVLEANKQLDELSSYIRALELGREELATLREVFLETRKPVSEKLQTEQQERLHQEQEKEIQRKQKIQEIKEQAEKLINSPSLNVEALVAERDSILEKMQTISLSKLEKQDIERQLKPLRDLISEKKESSLLLLSEDDRETLQQLKEILKQRKQRRQEIKEQIKKVGSVSGLGLEQAMNYNIQLLEEKERLEKINQGIREIEEKIIELERR